MTTAKPTTLYYATRTEAAPGIKTNGITSGPTTLTTDADSAFSLAYVSDFLLAGHAIDDVALFAVDGELLDKGKLSQCAGDGCYVYAGDIPPRALHLDRVLAYEDDCANPVDEDVWGEIERV